MTGGRAHGHDDRRPTARYRRYLPARYRRYLSAWYRRYLPGTAGTCVASGP